MGLPDRPGVCAHGMPITRFCGRCYPAPSPQENEDLAIGVRVFLRARDDRVAGMVTAILHEPGSLQYRVMWGTASVTWHYAFELSTQYVPTFKDA